MTRVDEVSAPITQRAETEVKPSAPVAGMILVVIVVEVRRAVPDIPVHAVRHGLCLRIMVGVRVVRIPAAPVVKVGIDAIDILNDACLFPSLELEIVSLRMSLIAYLRHHLRMTSGNIHQQLDFLERTGQRLLHIDMLTHGDSQHADGEVSEVGNGNAYCLELVGTLIKHLTEIREHLGIRMLGNRLLRLLAVRVHITQGDNLAQPCFFQITNNLTTAVGNAYASQFYLCGLNGRRFFLRLLIC